MTLFEAISSGVGMTGIEKLASKIKPLKLSEIRKWKMPDMDKGMSLRDVRIDNAISQMGTRRANVMAARMKRGLDPAGGFRYGK